MSVGLGFSVGDFISAIELVGTVIDVLCSIRLRSNLRTYELFEFVTNRIRIESSFLIRKFVTNRIEFETKIRTIRLICKEKPPIKIHF
jgi:hypothetical protein